MYETNYEIMSKYFPKHYKKLSLSFDAKILDKDLKLAGIISTIIMDEPTTHLDEKRRRELVEIMKRFFSEEASIPQMIIITHHSELEDAADTVYKVEKIEGISRVVEEY